MTENSPLPDWMRPDRAQLILLPANFQWNGYPVDVAVPAGEQFHEDALDWLKSYSAEHKRPLVYQIDNEWYAFGPPSFQADISRRLKAGERLWDIASH